MERTEYRGPPAEGIDNSKAAQSKQFERRQSQKFPGWKSQMTAMFFAEHEAELYKRKHPLTKNQEKNQDHNLSGARQANSKFWSGDSAKENGQCRDAQANQKAGCPQL
jgi:hypothetical protein